MRKAARRQPRPAAPPNAWPVCEAGTLPDRLDVDGWTLVEYWAPDNLFCRLLAPVRTALPTSHGTRLRLLCCVLDEPGDSLAPGPDAIPALILFHRGRPVRTWLGSMDVSLLQYHIDNALAAELRRTNHPVEAVSW